MSDKAERCPHCGLSIEKVNAALQGLPINEATKSEESSTSLSHQSTEKKQQPTWLKILIVVVSLLLLGSIALGLIKGTDEKDVSSVKENVVDTPSNKKEMDGYMKKASEFKASLPSGTEIVCEIIDTTAAKIVYLEEDSSYVSIYDLKDGAVTNVDMEGYSPSFCGYKARRYNDRLFMVVGTCSSGSYHNSLNSICYIDLHNNSLHWITDCEDASFLEDGIKVMRATLIDDSGASYEWEWKEDEYILPTSLSDKQYASKVKQEEADKYAWMGGLWHLAFTINDRIAGKVKFDVTMKINTNNHSIRFIDESGLGTDYSGTYTINESQNIISCSGNCVKFDPDRQSFYETVPDEWGFKKRVYYRKR